MRHNHHEAATLGLIEWTICIAPVAVAIGQATIRRKRKNGRKT